MRTKKSNRVVEAEALASKISPPKEEGVNYKEIINESEAVRETYLKSLVRNYFDVNQEFARYKNQKDAMSPQIKELMHSLELLKLQVDDITASISVTETSSFIDEQLLEIVRDLNVDGLIKTKEYVDMQVLETAIYRGLIDPSILIPCQVTNKTEKLFVKLSKKKVNTDGQD